MILPPEDSCPFTVETLSDPGDWQLMKLENGFLSEIGEQPLTDEKKELPECWYRQHRAGVQNMTWKALLSAAPPAMRRCISLLDLQLILVSPGRI